MRRVALVGLLVLSVGGLWPASGLDQTDSCSATTALAASPVVENAAPSCHFLVSCPFTAILCLRTVALDVNGTGQVAGTMSVELVFGDFGRIEDARARPAEVSCEGLFHCRAGSPDYLLIMEGGARVNVICTGGGLAALETVACSTTLSTSPTA
jgi:hypothetical protein